MCGKPLDHKRKRAAGCEKEAERERGQDVHRDGYQRDVQRQGPESSHDNHDRTNWKHTEHQPVSPIGEQAVSRNRGDGCRRDHGEPQIEGLVAARQLAQRIRSL